MADGHATGNRVQRATGSRAANWWKRVIDRWGTATAIRLAQRHAQRDTSPDQIHDYTAWRRSQLGYEDASVPPWGATYPTMSDYSVVWDV